MDEVMDRRQIRRVSAEAASAIFVAALSAGDPGEFAGAVGAGLPPTATYIVLAVITVDPMRKLGIDPWVAHFFVFLLAV